MVSSMRARTREELEVLRIIVTDVAVDMVNDLFRAKVATNYLLHHQPRPGNIARLRCMRMVRPFEINAAAAFKPATAPVGIVLQPARFRKSLPKGLRRIFAIVPKTAQHLLNVGRPRFTQFGAPYLLNMLRREFAAPMDFAERSAGDAKPLHPILDGRKANTTKIGYSLLRKPLVHIFSAQPGRISIGLHHTPLYHMPYSTTTFTN